MLLAEFFNPILIEANKAKGDAVSGGTMTAKEWDEWRLTQPTNNPHTRPLS